MRLKNGNVLLSWPLAKHILTQGMYSSKGVWHGAIDMRCTWDGTTRQPVYAAEEGTVTWVQSWDGKSTAGNQSYGNAVKIKHADYESQTLETRYAHLSEYLVKNGQAVKEGQLIGYTGNTGKSSGAHLHFEVILGGTRRNPLVWLDDDFTLAWDTVYTYGSGEEPVKKEEKETMTYTSDTLKIGPVSGGDRSTLKDLADGLGLGYEDQGDYLIVGPMSAGDRSTVAAKAQSLAVGCQDYFEPEVPQDQPQETVQVDLTQVLTMLKSYHEAQEKLAEELKEVTADMKKLLDKLAAAGKALQ